MAQVTSANLTGLRVGCKCNAPCARCIEIRTEASGFAYYALGERVVTFGADTAKAVNDVAAAEMTRRTELDSAVASNDVSTFETATRSSTKASRRRQPWRTQKPTKPC